MTRSRCRVAGTCVAELLADVVGEAGVGGDEQAGGQFVVFGLRDQVGGHVGGVRGVVGDDGHLGGAVLAVRADHAAQDPLGRRDVDVSGAGDHVHGGAVFRAVGEHRQSLGAARGVHLPDAEQGAGGEHGRVRQAAVVRLRRRRHGNRADAGDLGRDDVHHDRGGIGHQAARHVHPGPLDRHEAAGDGEAVGGMGGGFRRELGPVHRPGAAGGFFEGPLDVGVERVERLVERCLRHQGGGQVHVVEAGGVLADGLRAPAPDVVADGADHGGGGLDVGDGPGQDAGQSGPAELARSGPAQVDTGNHPLSLRSPIRLGSPFGGGA